MKKKTMRNHKTGKDYVLKNLESSIDLEEQELSDLWRHVLSNFRALVKDQSENKCQLMHHESEIATGIQEIVSIKLKISELNEQIESTEKMSNEKLRDEMRGDY